MEKKVTIKEGMGIFFTKMQGKIYGSILDFLETKCYPF